ncbi:mitofusin-2 isoform X1 [Patella vulgata]|uniref:mitofusin-2 isoform X1 n=1 Tax=Patella vulgata TaxID=6465 RepID=UPI0024A895B2|nr:mitofusin-2 isoform X1 [Patella vulgata]XP_050414690.2 mitofusin-2 isoform X1 [Patella vulgata]
MSGVLNRQLTMDDSQRGQGDAGGRQLGNGHSQGSALQFFGQAKKRINDIFKEIGEYIVETDKFVDDVVLSGQDIISQECCRVVKGFSQRVNGIMEILARDRMKVAFFGRTSNGKSTVINAMLRDKIMPSGIGHTTHCFIQVEGTDSSEGFLLTEGSDQPQSIGSIKQLAHNLSSVKLEENSLVRILWPKSKCRLLKEDVVFVDSPGIDVTQELDSWIDKYCLDADVFVLVGNAESTLMQTEKNFFHKVSERLSKPNIFILQNRWDVSVLEEDADDVRKQHSDRNLQFLIDELKVVDKKEAEDRLYFISAREALVSRLHEDKGTPTPTGSLQEGFHMRMFEFANFERKFEECISKSAVQTKFEQHTARGKNITSEVRGVMENTYIRSLELTEEQLSVRRGKNDELDYLGKQLKLLTQEVKDKIRSMVEDVERKVASALNDEIRRLSLLVEDFDRPFHPDNLLLNVYKKEMHAHVEQTLGRNLQLRCSTVLLQGITDTQNQMTERLSALLPNETRQHLFNQIPKRDFEIAYRLDCRNLCAEFREDIEFRFSFGPAALMQKLMGSKSARSALLGATSSISQPPANRAAGDAPGFTEHDNEVLASILSTFASLTSRSSLGTVAVAGVLAKAAGWRVIAVTGALYGLLYLYERLTWTTKAKERAFKQQYVEYASSKLRLIVDLTSSNCSHQVQQELSSTFARLCHQADISKNQLKEEIKMLDLVIEKLKETTNKAKTLRNKADWLDTELNSFTSSYLTDST